jgi:hypothetical protein
MKTKIENMRSKNGNKIANQFIIRTPEAIFFQSYNSIIAKKENGKIILDEYFWNYSQTTGKYRNIFLGETKKETEEKIKAGIYKLANLN